MDAVTYPDEALAAAIDDSFVPVKLISGENPELSRACMVRWLPAVVVMDKQRRVHHSSIGFLPPDQLGVELLHGRAMAAMAAKSYEEADGLFTRITEEHGEHHRAPEAAFWHGVSAIRHTKDFANGLRKFMALADRWPSSEWATKVGWMKDALG